MARFSRYSRYGRYAGFGEFTGNEKQIMDDALSNVASTILKHEAAYALTRVIPINYVLETQRDAMTRAGDLLTADRHTEAQLKATYDDVYASGDPAKLKSWLALADTVTDAGAASVYWQQIGNGNAVVTAYEVAKDTAKQIGDPFAWPWWLWGIAGVGALILLRPFAEAFTSSRKEKR